MKTVYISIGNSDDKLTQKEWACFCEELLERVMRHATAVHGTLFSLPHTQWQSACVCIVVSNHAVAEVKRELRACAGNYRQDSIAMAVVDEVEMVKP